MPLCIDYPPVVPNSWFDEPANEYRGSTWQTPPKPLPKDFSDEQRAKIERLLRAQEQFQDVPEIYLLDYDFPQWMNGDSFEQERKYRQYRQERNEHLWKLTQRNMDLIREFCQQVSSIQDIPATDLENLFQTHWEDLLLIRYARKFDLSANAVRLVPGEPAYSVQQHFCWLYGEHAAQQLFQLFQNVFVPLHLDEVEFALLQAIVFLTPADFQRSREHPNPVVEKKLEYENILISYMEQKRGNQKDRFKLMEFAYSHLRSLNGNMIL